MPFGDNTDFQLLLDGVPFNSVIQAFKNLTDTFTEAASIARSYFEQVTISLDIDFSDEQLRDVATGREYFLLQHGKRRVRKKYRNKLTRKKNEELNRILGGRRCNQS